LRTRGLDNPEFPKSDRHFRASTRRPQPPDHERSRLASGVINSFPTLSVFTGAIALRGDGQLGGGLRRGLRPLVIMELLAAIRPHLHDHQQSARDTSEAGQSVNEPSRGFAPPRTRRCCRRGRAPGRCSQTISLRYNRAEHERAVLLGHGGHPVDVLAGVSSEIPRWLNEVRKRELLLHLVAHDCRGGWSLRSARSRTGRRRG